MAKRISKTTKITLVTAAVVAIPLVLWLDVWLSFVFGAWTATVGADMTGQGMLGFFAFVALVACQGIGVYLITEIATDH